MRPGKGQVIKKTKQCHETANSPLIPVKIKFDSIQCNSTVPTVKMFSYCKLACSQGFTSGFDKFMNKYKEY